MNAVKFSIGIALLCGCIWAASLEMIPSVSVRFGGPTGIDLGNYRIRQDRYFSIQDTEDFEFEMKGDSLYITPHTSARGIHPVDLLLGEEKFTLMIKVQPTVEVDFTYPGSKNGTDIFVMGYFNDWSRTSHKLSKGADNDWHLKLYMMPGSYEYKFVVDKMEVLDSANPDSLANGIGGFNSIKDIGKEMLENPGMFIKDSFKVENDTLSLYFSFVSATSDEIVNENKVWVTFENYLLNKKYWDYENGHLTLAGSVANLTGTLRIFSENSNGLITRENHTLLRDGQLLTTENAPDDWHFSVIYSIIVDRFHDGDKSNNRSVNDPDIHPMANFQGGDIAGIQQKLEDGYFSKLGVSALWISPIIQNAEGGFTEFVPPNRKYTGYHGYWPTDPRKPDNRFTTETQLKEFVSIAHSKDTKILLDFVSNHTHKDHPYFTEHRNWFGQVELPDGTMNIRNWSGETMLTTWFDTFLPSYDFVSNPEAIDQVVEDAVYWITEYNFDGFRQDATKHVPHTFWKKLTSELKKSVPDGNFFQIGESFGSNELIGAYVNPGELDSQFNFELYFEGRWQFSGHPDFFKLNRTVSTNLDFFQPVNTMGTITSSHDQVRFMGFADGQVSFEENGTERGFADPPIEVKDESSYNKLLMFNAYNMCLPGVPVVYYGEEIGQIGANDPDNRRMMRFDDQLTSTEKRHLQNMSQLIKLRRQYPSLSIGDLLMIHQDQNVTCWMKIYFDERILILFNNSPDVREATLNISSNYGRAVSLMDRSFVDIKSGLFNTQLHPYQTKIYQLMD
ncbi:MAG: hypothetical protein HQ510_12640 [Candidatus Marinimicrobia bacterium]|nr:hypothetical protein [Candidatus Neomarinimicrobiota bacterium]